MSPDVPPELAETFQNLEQVLEEFRQIKEQLHPGTVHGAASATAAPASPVKSEATS
ncbi:MAG TPA: hypothetical protein VJ725_18055 [Thermoanaerobaculia bacterium]|nr:hypothetical protein [Thermoanaerobaculia bacterium]